MKRVCANVAARRRSLVLFWFILGHDVFHKGRRARGRVVSQHKVVNQLSASVSFERTVEQPCAREGACQSARLRCAHCSIAQAQRTVIEAVVVLEPILIAIALGTIAEDGAMTFFGSPSPTCTDHCPSGRSPPSSSSHAPPSKDSAGGRHGPCRVPHLRTASVMPCSLSSLRPNSQVAGCRAAFSSSCCIRGDRAAWICASLAQTRRRAQSTLPDH